MASAHRKRFTWTALAVGAMLLTASSPHGVGHEAPRQPVQFAELGIVARRLRHEVSVGQLEVDPGGVRLPQMAMVHQVPVPLREWS